MYRRVFVKGPMSSGCVIVARVGAQQMAQMRLAIDNDVVQVLPRRARRDRFIPNAHCAEALPHDGTEDAVSVADQVPWRWLRDLEAELEKLAMDARRAPEWVIQAHPPDERAQVRIDLRAPSSIPGLPAPVAAKPSAMPAN